MIYGSLEISLLDLGNNREFHYSQAQRQKVNMFTGITNRIYPLGRHSTGERVSMGSH